MRARALVAGVGLAVALAGAPAQAADAGIPVVAGPGSYLTNYQTVVVAVPVGGPAIIVSVDLQPHDVFAVALSPTQCPSSPGICPAGTPSYCLPPDPTQPWTTGPTNPLSIQAGLCPLFWSDLISPGYNGKATAPVLGLENLVAGTIYDFYCSIHQNMKAKLVALPGSPY